MKVLILGSDANAYYMARCAYEYTHKKPHLIAKDRLAFTKFSNILTIEYVPNLWKEKAFVKALNMYAERYNDKILVISTNETYSIFLARNKKILDKKLIFFNQKEDVLLTLTDKEKFYKTYENSEISFPKTYYYDTLKDDKIPKFDYPMILKPADVVSYNHLSFDGKNKIYKINSEKELKDVIKKIKKAGYKERLIMQEYIEGDDSHLFDSVVYVDKQGKVKAISFAQIGIQERSKSMVGNAAALINGFNTFGGDTESMKKNIISFMENLKMNGFFEFDMKYDSKSNTFKVLEINARQGRCSYYISPLGANLVEIMTKDLILNEDLPFKDLKDEILLSFVPKSVIKKYVSNDEFKNKALSLWHKRVSPMEYIKDTNIKRFLMMKKRLYHYNEEYKNSYWEE